LKTLSVKGSWAYYLAAGLKNVENRTWDTTYRGTLAIHISGQHIRSMVAPDDARLPVFTDYFKLVDPKSGAVIKDRGKYWTKDTDGMVRFAREWRGDPLAEREFALFDWCMLRLSRNIAPMPAHAIIGTVELYDIVRDSPSPWAEAGQYHWLVRNACFFPEPVLEIKGRLGLWDYQGKLPAPGR